MTYILNCTFARRPTSVAINDPRQNSPYDPPFLKMLCLRFRSLTSLPLTNCCPNSSLSYNEPRLSNIWFSLKIKSTPRTDLDIAKMWIFTVFKKSSSLEKSQLLTILFVDQPKMIRQLLCTLQVTSRKISMRIMTQLLTEKLTENNDYFQVLLESPKVSFYPMRL